MNFDYQEICQELIRDLSEKQREIILRRFGLKNNQKETLSSIGKSFDISRERVRQIEKVGFSKLKSKVKKYQKVFQSFNNYLKNQGGLKKEDFLLTQFGGEKFQNQIFFLLTLGESFQRFSENKDFYSFWTINLSSSLDQIQKNINFFYNKFKENNQLLKFADLKSLTPLPEKTLISYLEISKIIQKNEEDFFGLRDWPEINPRGIKDKIYLVFKKIKTPLHYLEITKLIGPNVLSQTIHNELIRDPRFILIGRGIYALKEWGYKQGDVKDIILEILKESSKPLSKEEILEKVLKQRFVKKNTILLNLNNKKYFQKNIQGKYFIKEI